MDELDNRNKELLELCKKQEEKIKELTLKLASAENDNKISVPSYEQLEGMERLTDKKENNVFKYYHLKPDITEDAKIQKWNYYDAIRKLGQLEDIEEGLGISLITLFKAFKEGFVDCDNKYHHFTNLYIDDE